MKRLIFVFITGVLLVSCSKKDVSTPGAANQNVFFKNANIEVENLQASKTAANAVTVNFSTVYEKDVRRIELMSSSSTNTFCSIQGVDIENNSQTIKKYSLQDTSIKNNTMYYLLRIEDNNGNWSYSNYCTVEVN